MNVETTYFKIAVETAVNYGGQKNAKTSYSIP